MTTSFAITAGDFDSIYYMEAASDVISRIGVDARAADELHERARRLLVAAARSGASAGLTQRQISEAIGRSQPEVSRLLRFQGRSTLGRRLAAKRAAVLETLSAAGVSGVRVFGSVSRGEDTEDSDIDLLVDLPQAISLFGLSRLESELSELLGAKVDLVPASDLRENLRDHVLAEAVPL